MKSNLTLFAFVFLGSILAPQFVIADGGGIGTGDPEIEFNPGGPNGGGGGGGCSGPPPSSPPASEITACSKAGDACTPSNPPASSFAWYCCYTTAGNNKVNRLWRPQCCGNGSSWTWKIAYKQQIVPGERCD